jgi:hypothetical protein
MLHGECKKMATSKPAEMLNMVAELLVDGGGNHFLLKMGSLVSLAISAINREGL